MERLYGVYWNGWEWNETIRNGMKDSMYMRFIMYGIVYTGWQIMDGWMVRGGNGKGGIKSNDAEYGR